MSNTQLPFGFRIVGSLSGTRKLVKWHDAFNAYAACDERAKVESECYLSAFAFGEAFRAHLARTGSTAAYGTTDDHLCWASWLWWDIDREDNLDEALADARTLCVNLTESFGVEENAILLFYSGSKGFHAGIPTALWSPPPGPDFHRIARQFCETFAESLGIAIDKGVYDAVRAFRAPNSRHPKTGRHKRRLTVDELLHHDITRILKLAESPEPFELPDVKAGGGAPGPAAAWDAAAAELGRMAEASARQSAGGTDGALSGAGGGSGARLNRLTLDFIANGATVGDRHRVLYSAARNLGEFGCPPALAHALLTEAARDNGLPPRDIHRQIECGLKDSLVGMAIEAKGGVA